MFLKSNQALNRILLHGRKNDQWIPIKHLETHGLHDKMDWNKAEEAGLLHMRKKTRGYEVNLSQKGYHTLSNLYRT